MEHKGKTKTVRMPPPHLNLQALMASIIWSSCLNVLPKSNPAWQSWKNMLEMLGKKELAEDLEKADHQELLKSLSLEVKDRISKLESGIESYLNYPNLNENLKPRDVVWQKNSVELLDYRQNKSKSNKPLVLVIPSLINSYKILDLLPESSFLENLSDYTDPFVLNWSSPEPSDSMLDSEGYIKMYILEALEFLATKYEGRKILLLGYCMGGVLAMATAQVCKQNISGLILLATPFDFRVNGFNIPDFSDADISFLESVISGLPFFPAPAIQGLFYANDPWLFHKRYIRFAELIKMNKEDEVRFFVAVEEWANSGQDISSALARECLVDWAIKNIIHNKSWKVMGKVISPSNIKIPVFSVSPLKDKVVPIESSKCFAREFKDITIINPPCGHVGIMSGKMAEDKVWKPMREWLLSNYF